MGAPSSSCLRPGNKKSSRCWPLEAFEALQLQGAQLRLGLGETPASGGARLAVGAGFSLHADTAVQANDRDGLARLCRYGARGPIAESRLSRRDDGKYVYETKKGVALVLSAQQLVRRLLWLIVPPRIHLTSFHGVFASHAKARTEVMPTAPPASPPTDVLPAAKAKRPRLDWATLHARTWAVDVWRCPCGGKRKVTAIVTSRSTAEQMLRDMGLTPPPFPPLTLAQAPPQLELPVG